MKLPSKTKTMAGICIFALLAVVVGVANAEPILTAPGGVLDTIYGLENLQVVAGDEDQLWENLGEITVEAKGKWAAYIQKLGFLPDESGGGFEHLFTVRGSGYLHGVPSAAISIAESGEVFRFADNPSCAPMWSSLPSDNVDGKDHMKTFEVIGGGAATGNYVICWEDLPCLGDADYQDLIVEVGGGATPVPEPGTLALLCLGGVGMLGFRRCGRW